MSDYSKDPSPGKPIRKAYIGEMPIDAVYMGEKLLWPRDDFELDTNSISDLMQSHPNKCLTAQEFAALESRDSGVLYIVLGSLLPGSKSERHRLQ